MPRVVSLFLLWLLSVALPTTAEQPTSFQQHSDEIKEHIETLEEPLYTPFIERYMLDELKQLRAEQAQAKQELIQQIVDREHNSVDRAVTYATDTVTYFFYLIAAASSVLVLVGWNSIRDIKDKVHAIADTEISNLVSEYETRLENIEKQLKHKTKSIDKSLEANREEIELTQEVQSLWLKAQQEITASNKIKLYDDILKLKPGDCDALSYKADAVLELNEPQWAVNLCHQALEVDSENAHACYQLSCAYTALNDLDEALHWLINAITLQSSYRDEALEDPALQPLAEYPPCQEVLGSSEES